MSSLDSPRNERVARGKGGRGRKTARGTESRKRESSITLSRHFDAQIAEESRRKDVPTSPTPTRKGADAVSASDIDVSFNLNDVEYEYGSEWLVKSPEKPAGPPRAIAASRHANGGPRTKLKGLGLLGGKAVGGTDSRPPGLPRSRQNGVPPIANRRASDAHSLPRKVPASLAPVRRASIKRGDSLQTKSGRVKRAPQPQPQPHADTHADKTTQTAASLPKSTEWGHRSQTVEATLVSLRVLEGAIASAVAASAFGQDKRSATRRRGRGRIGAHVLARPRPSCCTIS